MRRELEEEWKGTTKRDEEEDTGEHDRAPVYSSKVKSTDVRDDATFVVSQRVHEANAPQMHQDWFNWYVLALAFTFLI